jgi:hypothetical protein
MFTGKSDIRDVPRDEIIQVAESLPPRIGAELIREYDQALLEDFVGAQWNLNRKEISDEDITKAGTVRKTAGQIEMSRNQYKDLSLEDRIDAKIAAVRNFDALISVLGKSDEAVANAMPNQPNTLARQDLAAALEASVSAPTYVSKGPGQVGSHAVGGFRANQAKENALQYLYDMGRDRALGTRTVLPQQGHVLDAYSNPEIAGDHTLMRGQEGEVNMHDGSPEKLVKLSRAENLNNGRVKAMEDLKGLLGELQASGASDETLSRLLSTMMELGDSSNQINKQLSSRNNSAGDNVNEERPMIIDSHGGDIYIGDNAAKEIRRSRIGRKR